MCVSLGNEYCNCWLPGTINTLRPRQNGRHFPEDILKCIFLNENLWILKTISLKYVPYGLIIYMAVLLKIMDWQCWYVVLTHLCVTWPQWVKSWYICPLVMSKFRSCIYGNYLWRVKSLWSSDVIRCCRNLIPLVQVMACACSTPNHYFNHRSLIGKWTLRNTP